MSTQISAHCLVDLLDVFALDDGGEVRRRVLAVAAEELDAEVVAVICDGTLIDGVGVEAGTDRLRQLLEAVDSEAPDVDLDGVGAVRLASLPIENRATTRFVIGRTSVGFAPGDLELCTAMVRLMRLAVRTIAAFGEQRAATEQLEAEVTRNRELAAELQRRHTDLMARMLDIQDKLSSPDDSVLATLIDQGSGLFAGDVVALHLHNDRGDLELCKLTINAGSAIAEALADGERLPAVGRAIADNRLTIDDADLSSLGIEATMSAPIHQRQRSIGAVTVLSGRPGGRFQRDEQETLLLLAGYASVAFTDAVIIDERQQALEHAEWQATHDALTGLANRRLVLDTIDRRMADGHRVGIVYLDVDRFKSVNDLYGHQVGDDFLKAFADRLSEVTRPSDLVGRLAGDEFIVVTGEELSEAQMERMARRLGDDLGGTIEVEGRAIGLTVSIGLAYSDGLRAAAEVINAADVAMYQAKNGGRNRTGVFDGALQNRIKRRAAIAERLRAASVDGSGLHVVYQPIVDLVTGEVQAHEALLRMTDPVLGAVGTDEFIPLAEELGVIAAIDNWVLATALQETAETGVTTRLSVNVSPAWLINPEVVDLVRRTAEGVGFPLDRLSIEVTERVALADNVTVTLAGLRELGVRILLDDFGTGYSSLAYIRTLDIDGIKIDRAFLADLDGDRHRSAILDAILTLTNRLGALAIAEGVECAEQADLLRDYGCRLAQGFLFGRPRPAPEGLLLAEHVPST